MPDYSKSKIYKLQCDDGHYYIGSTSNELKKRLWGHRSDAKLETKRRVYQYFNEIGWDKVVILLVEDYPCDKVEKLHLRESELIRNARDDPLCLNSHSPVLDVERQKKRVDAYNKQYHQANRERKLQYNTEYYNNNRDRLVEITRQYREENNETINERRRQNYQENKEDIRIQMKEYRESRDEAKKEANRLYLRQYHHAHREKAKERARIYYQQNKERWAVYKQNKSRQDINGYTDTRAND